MRESEARNYLQRQWQGDLPLAQSFWLNLILVTFAVSIVFAMFAAQFPDTPRLPILVSFLAAFVVWLWGAVGACVRLIDTNPARTPKFGGVWLKQ